MTPVPTRSPVARHRVLPVRVVKGFALSVTLLMGLGLGLGAGLGLVNSGLGAGPGAAALAPASTRDSASLGSIMIPNLGSGYTVSSQGPLNPSQFASDSPDPSAAASALSTLSTTVSTYERVWQANGGSNQVQDLIVRFPSSQDAHVFLSAAQQSLESGEIVSTGPLASIPGARLVTYFTATNKDGVGEAITMRAGVYVALLSFFAAQDGNPQPITPSDAERVALAQHATLVSATGAAEASPASRSAHSASAPTAARRGASSKDIGWAVLAVVIIALAVATPRILRYRRERHPT